MRIAGIERRQSNFQELRSWTAASTNINASFWQTISLLRIQAVLQNLKRGRRLQSGRSQPFTDVRSGFGLTGTPQV